MTISKEANGNDLVVKVAGRLDTTTAPELENSLNESIGSIGKLTLDFAELEYISSAGLRVLLSASKKIGNDNFTIKNVNEIVSEVFEVTGFSDILNIE